MLLSDPLAYPFLAPLGWTLSGLFGSSLLVLLLTLRGRIGTSVLFQRWRTWLLIAPLYSLVVLSGPLAIALFAAALGIQCAREYARLSALPGIDRAVLLVAAGIMPLACLGLPLERLGVALLLLPLLATLPALVAQDAEHGATRAARLAFGLFYVPVALSALVLLDQKTAPGLLLALGLAVALSDVGAFCLGKLLKGPRLAPRLSPAKTWAGCLGNLAGAAVGLVLLRPLIAEVPLAPLLAATTSGAVWGDLLESLLKREASAKDSGTWLTGFGGLLDRVDSLIVVVPLSLVLLQVMP